MSSPFPLKVPYLKDAGEIYILYWPLDEGPNPEGSRLRLGEKIIEYRYTANLPPERVSELLSELLVKGETTVFDLRSPERLALEEAEDRTTRGQALSLLDDFMAETEERQRKWEGGK